MTHVEHADYVLREASVVGTVTRDDGTPLFTLPSDEALLFNLRDFRVAVTRGAP